MARPASAAPVGNAPPSNLPSSMPSLNSSSQPYGAALGGSRSSVGSRRGARNKYVDIMNPDAGKSTTSSSSSMKSFLPPTTGLQLLGSDGSQTGSTPRIMMV
jgi:hypothetical protein